MDDTASTFSEASTLKPLLSGQSSAQPDQPIDESSYFFYTTKVVDKMPEKKVEDPTSKMSKFKAFLKPPAVKAAENVPQREGKFYHVNEQGQIIETKVTRAFLKPGMNAFGGNFKQSINGKV
jgi:hypothetical protein